MTINVKSQKKRLETTIKNAGPRYTPGFNVEVSIAIVLDGFGRNFTFYDDLKNRTGKFISATHSPETEKVKALLGEKYFAKLTKESEDLVKTIRKIPNSGGKVDLPFGLIEKQCQKVRDRITEAFDVIRELKAEEEKKNPPKEDQYRPEIFHDERNYLNRLANEVGELMYFARGRTASAANKKFLVLRGEAGSGKTHFLCDLAKSRIDNKLPTYIFLGQEFNDKDPWKVILNKIGWTGSRTDFLEALERNAASKQTRAFIIIDAINEQKAKVLWSSLVKDTAMYKSICLILSVRTGFEFTVLSKTVRKIAFDLIHEGFADREWNALTSFFQFYNLEPDLPLLFPDFTNPLFLKIFCETYQQNGTTVQLRGHLGFTKVFEQYVKKQGKKALTDIGSTNLDAQDLVWRKTIKKIADYMVTNKTERIPVYEAESIVRAIFPGQEKAFLDALEKNWLLLKNPIYADSAPYGVIGFDYAFPYQKFSDHLIVRHLLSDSSTISDPKTLFGPSGRLNYIFQETWKFRGLIDALAVQIPERFESKELILLAGADFKKMQIAKDSFLQSLIWRDMETKNGKLRFFNEKRILGIINSVVFKYREGFDETMETILTVTAIPKHPLNAYLLSSYLGKFTLAKRDSIWTPFLFHKHDNSSAVDRLIHWAVKISHQTSYDKESIKLVGISLAWFLSSSNRFLRDASTKALVSLLKNRVPTLIEILIHFEGCNDPYIQERLLAAAYGCSMLSKDPSLYDLGFYIYKRIFAKKKPPVHILIRDYARGIVEAALRKHPRLEIKVNRKLIVPPYGSKWPDKIPTLEYLKRTYKDSVYKNTTRSGYGDIWSSLMYNNEGGIADFGNYVLNSAVGNWSGKRLLKNGKPPKSDKQIADEFIESLKPNQKRLWEEYQTSKRSIPISIMLSFGGKNEEFGPKVDKAKVAAATKKTALIKKAFERSLSEKDWIGYKKALKYFEGRWSRKGGGVKMDQPDFASIQRWVFQKVIRLGWTPKLFYSFDSNSSERGRSANKAERIGKKYQWIALHEILARLADNFAFKKWREEYSLYQGPWSIYKRDIDPSHKLALFDEPKMEKAWWANKKYDNWQKSLPHEKWVYKDNASDLLDKFFSTKDAAGNEWLCLEGYFKWREPKLPGSERVFSVQKREVWIMVRAVIVKESDAQKIYEWVKSKNISWGWLPDPVDMTHIYLGEYPNSSAYYDEYWDGNTRWQNTRGKEDQEPVFPVLLTTEKYMNEATTFDCSVNDTVHVYFPSKELVDGLKLTPGDTPGQFVDDTGLLIAQDPSIKAEGENSLLIRKDKLLAYLKANKYSLMWIVLGEKIVFGSAGNNGILDMGGTYLMDPDGKITGSKYTEIRDRVPRPKKRSKKK